MQMELGAGGETRRGRDLTVVLEAGTLTITGTFVLLLYDYDFSIGHAMPSVYHFSLGIHIFFNVLSHWLHTL